MHFEKESTIWLLREVIEKNIVLNFPTDVQQI